MRYAVLRAVLAICTLMPHWSAIAQRTPTDTELRASYCIPIVNFQINLSSAMIQQINAAFKSTEYQERFRRDPSLAKQFKKVLTDSQRELANMQSNVRRLQLYILPRMQEIDPLPLLIATKRAEEDLGLIGKAVDVCTRECANNPDGARCLTDCIMSRHEEFKDRLDPCRNLSWLPF